MKRAVPFAVAAAAFALSACQTPAPVTMQVFAQPPQPTPEQIACLFDPPAALPVPPEGSGWTEVDIARAFAAARAQVMAIQGCGQAYIRTIWAWAASFEEGTE